MYKLFAVCAPGLEPFTAQELNQLGFTSSLSSSPSKYSSMRKELTDEVGGVEFQGSLRDVYRANLCLRTASRVLVRLGAFYAAVFPELRRKASRLPWEHYLSPGQPVSLRVTCHNSRLYHERALAERVAGAIGDRLGQSPSIQKLSEDADTNLPQLIVVRLVADHCTISVDSSGGILHKRGYQLAIAKAPLRETLAAGMLLASGWDTKSPLLDPFCGSGTIAIEAALLARQIPPGHARHFAFMGWPNFYPEIWNTLLSESKAVQKSSLPKIIGSDRDSGAIETAMANAKRAGVADSIEFSHRAVSAIEPPPGPGWVVTNPPYGVRVSSNKDLRNLYAQFGKVLCTKCPSWRIAMLCNSVQLLRNTGLEFDKGISLMNGGLKVRLVTGRVR